MMGCVSLFYTGSGQFKAGILHWTNSIDGSISWLLVPSHDVNDVKVTPTSMEVSNRHGIANITFFVNAPQLNVSIFTGTNWNLPGITLDINVDPSLIDATVIDSPSAFTKAYYTGQVDTVIQVTCAASSIVLTPRP
nr:hypothetical protein [Candidatus Sigynarchaeota archaeon]